MNRNNLPQHGLQAAIAKSLNFSMAEARLLGAFLTPRDRP